jgi:putative ABC transport system ATP-binding protein
VRALDDVSLQVAAGEWLAVMGPSGSGKSTLVNLVGCLDQPTSGSVLIDGIDVARLNGRELTRVRAEKIGLVFQQFHLVPYLTAIENIMLAQYFHSMSDEAEALEALRRVGLAERARHLPAYLSGGEQQRVCIARALINDPKVILADEPTGNLDAANEAIVLRILHELHAQGRTIVMVTHDPVVARLADRRIELHHGRIATQEMFAMSDETQFDEVLEEMWITAENGEKAELERLVVDGPLPIGFALERMATAGLLTLQPHGDVHHAHRVRLNRCHDFAPADAALPPGDGSLIVEFTERGRQRASNVIRRHRLAERLFADTLHWEDDLAVESQACKFEHILSTEATDRICGFLGHPETCPHANPIPAGECCARG